MRYFPGPPAALGVLAWLVLAAPPPSQAQGRDSPPERDRVDFVLGNVEFALLHELAHLAIGELNLPILGPEEQAADYLATMSLIRPREEPPMGSAQWLTYAFNAADAFIILWQLGQKTGASYPFWDSHGLSIQRFYTIGCLVYGSDPERFGALPEILALPPQRSEICEAEYARAVRSLDWWIATFGRKAGEPQRGAVAVRFDAPHSRTSEYLVGEIERIGVIDWTLRRLQDLIVLDEDATVVMRSCGMPEAAWVPERRELVFCYELLDLYYALSGDWQRHGLRSVLD